jgi:hypothetical protein
MVGEWANGYGCTARIRLGLKKNGGTIAGMLESGRTTNVYL